MPSRVMPGPVTEAVVAPALQRVPSFYGHTHPLTKITWLHKRPLTFVNLTFGEIAIIVIFLGMCIPYMLGAESSGSLIHYITAAALIPITKRSLLLYILNVPWDRAIRFHRWIGRFVLFVALEHTIWEMKLFYDGDIDNDRRRMLRRSRRLLDMSVKLVKDANGNLVPITGWAAVEEYTFNNGANLAGLLATGMLLLFTLLSLGFIRRKFYKFFQITHWLLFFLYCVFTVMHYSGGGFIAAIMVPMILFAVDVGFQIFKSWKATLSKCDSLPGDVIKIAFPRPENFEYEAGQYVFLARATAMGGIEWHPFTLSSSPEEEDITVHIRAYNNWTDRLVKDAKNGTLTEIRVSPAYGVLSVPVFQHEGVLMLLCAGIGCTPMMSIAKSLYAQGKLTHKLKSVYLVWTVRDAGQLSWFDGELEEIAKNAPNFKVKLFVTRGKGDAPGNRESLDTEMGKRPDLPGLFEEISILHPDLTVGVLVCGPTALSAEAMKLCGTTSRARGSEHPFLFHTETFEM